MFRGLVISVLFTYYELSISCDFINNTISLIINLSPVKINVMDFYFWKHN